MTDRELYTPYIYKNVFLISKISKEGKPAYYNGVVVSVGEKALNIKDVKIGVTTVAFDIIKKIESRETKGENLG